MIPHPTIETQDAADLVAAECRWGRFEVLDPVQEPLFVHLEYPAVELVGMVAPPHVVVLQTGPSSQFPRTPPAQPQQ